MALEVSVSKSVFVLKKNRTWAKALHLSLVQAVEDHLVSPRQCLMHRASHLPVFEGDGCEGPGEYHSQGHETAQFLNG